MRKTKNKKSKPARRKSNASGNGHLSIADAAERVLRDSKKALKYSQVSRIAIDKGWIHTESKTPEISMYVTLRSEIKRRDERKEPQRFMFLGNGLFTLVDLIIGAPPRKTKTAVEQVRDSRNDACKQLYEKLTSTNQGSNFESMVSDLLIAMGYDDVEVIGGKDDQGVDILCRNREGILTTRIAIQCKCKLLRQEIGPKDVSNLRDNLSSYQCQQGIVVTTSKLNQAARDKAKEPGKEPIHFIEHRELLDLFAEYGIGLRNETLAYFQLDTSAYDFLK